MVTHAEPGAKRLRDADPSFRNVGAQNPALADKMTGHAAVYEPVADRLAIDPPGQLAPDETSLD